jgi:hypothetical protein
MTPITIPHQALAPDTLRAMLEDFVTRQAAAGHGESEAALAARVDQVLSQLEDGKVVILYDADEGSFNIAPKASPFT